MDGDDESTKNNKTKRKEGNSIQRYGVGLMFIFQPIWVRCRPILFNDTYGKYLESQFRFVLYCGSIFWLLYLLV